VERRAPFFIALGALWLSVPLTALHFWRAWRQLPLQLATHFDARWQPNGWSPREDAVGFAFGVLGFVLLVVTAACALVRSRKPAQAWPLLVLSAGAVGFIAWMVNQLVSRNLLAG
jgi:hypothetical protein